MALMKHISVSKIEAYLRCPLAVKYRYVDKIPEYTAPVLVAGSAFHEMMEFSLREKARTGSHTDPKTLDDMFGPAWDRRFEDEAKKKTFIGIKEDPEDPLDQMKEQYRALVRLSAKEVLPTMNPWIIDDTPVIEHRIDLELESEVGKLMLLGFADYLDISGVLMDWKTTKSYDEEGQTEAEKKESLEYKRVKQLKGWAQFAAYSLWSWPVTGMEIQPARKIVLTRGKDPRVDYVDFQISPRHRDYFVKLAADVWKAIYHDVWPANNTGWWCSQKFCSFYDSCQEGVAVPEAAEVPE
jgi:CRISPR/Cas system-associated exonuclease Cas4 (RecB family)